jgi:hypothetical protein
MVNKDTTSDLDSILFNLEWKATFEHMTQADRIRFKQAIQAYCQRREVEALSEARKWATKAETADQVWQQLTDRINRLQNILMRDGGEE